MFKNRGLIKDLCVITMKVIKFNCQQSVVLHARFNAKNLLICYVYMRSKTGGVVSWPCIYNKVLRENWAKNFYVENA